MKTISLSVRGWLLRNWRCMVLIASSALQAAELEITPTTVSDQYSGLITINITDVRVAQTVRIELFRDINGNGAVDAGEPLLQSLSVTDGIAPSIGGIRNPNIPGDEDGAANGALQILWSIATSSESARIAGDYLFLVSSSEPGAVPVAGPFTVTREPAPQALTGIVRSSAGSSIPYATVVLMAQDFTFRGLVTADAFGRFRMDISPGTYWATAFQDGYVGSFLSMPMAVVTANQDSSVEIPLDPAERIVSGRTVDAETGQGIPGMMITFGAEEPETGMSLGFSDREGAFVLHTGIGVASLVPSEYDAMRLGYLVPGDFEVDTTEGNATDVKVPLTKATALIWGTLRDDQDNPLPNVFILAEDDASNFESAGVSMAPSGSYTIAVAPGTWRVSPATEDLARFGVVCESSTVSLSEGEAVRVDLKAARPTAHLRGLVMDETGAAVGNLTLHACPSQYSGSVCPNTDVGWDGRFDFGLSGGIWNLFLSGDVVDEHKLVAPSLTFSMIDGTDQDDIEVILRTQTASIRVSLTDETGSPLSDIFVSAFTEVNGIHYRVGEVTADDGTVALPVFCGPWRLWADCMNLQSLGAECLEEKPVDVCASDIFVALTAPRAGLFKVEISSPLAATPGEEHSITLSAPGDISFVASVIGRAGAIRKVEFFESATLRWVDEEFPYEFAWTNGPEGFYSVLAKATDDQGAIAYSDPIGIAVRSSLAGDPVKLMVGSRMLDQSVPIYLLTSPGERVTLQQSSDLVNWTSSEPMTLLSGFMSLHPKATGEDHLFFKAGTETPPLRLIGLSATQARPGSVLTVQASGLDPAKEIVARFSASSGFHVEVPIVRVSSSEVQVSVPPFYDADLRTFASGKVNVRLVQRDNASETISNIQSDFLIEDLPETTLPAGTITRAFLLGSARETRFARSGINWIDIASGGTPTGDAVADALAQIEALALGAMADVEAILDDPRAKVQYGTLAGEPLILDSETLAVSDRLILSWLLEVQSRIPAVMPSSAIAPQSLRLPQKSPCASGRVPPPLIRAEPDDLAGRIYKLREYAEKSREWAESGAGYIQSLRSALKWVPPVVPKADLVAAAASTAHVIDILAGTMTSLVLDVAASHLETGSLEYNDWKVATEYIQRNKLYATSGNILLTELAGGIGGVYLPDDLVNLGKYAAGFGDPLSTLLNAQQPNAFWADETILARQAGPLPVLTVSGCLSQISEGVAAHSSIFLAVSDSDQALLGNSDERGFYQVQVPVATVGDSIPAHTTLSVVTEQGERQTTDLDLLRGSQVLDIAIGPSSPGTEPPIDPGVSDYVTLTVSVSPTGTGGGTIAVEPPGPEYPKGTVVQITAHPREDSVFSGFSGDCSGIGTCTITMDSDRFVTGVFDLGPLTFSGQFEGSTTGKYIFPKAWCAYDHHIQGEGTITFDPVTQTAHFRVEAQDAIVFRSGFEECPPGDVKTLSYRSTELINIGPNGEVTFEESSDEGSVRFQGAIDRDIAIEFATIRGRIVISSPLFDSPIEGQVILTRQ